MTTKTEELILELLFKLSEQLIKLSERVSYIEKNMATKDDIKNMATKDDLKELETRIEAKMDARFDKQAEEIATMFHDTFKTTTKYQKQSERKIISLMELKNKKSEKNI